MKALLNTNTQHKQVATQVAERVAQLLCAEVFVLDEDNYVIASSNPKFIRSITFRKKML